MPWSGGGKSEAGDPVSGRWESALTPEVVRRDSGEGGGRKGKHPGPPSRQGLGSGGGRAPGRLCS